MSTNQSPTNNSNGNGKPEAGKKRKSPGFIETTGFKPSWLETGPLTPEILSDSFALQRNNIAPEDEASWQTEGEATDEPAAGSIVDSIVETAVDPALLGEPLPESVESIPAPADKDAAIDWTVDASASTYPHAIEEESDSWPWESLGLAPADHKPGVAVAGEAIAPIPAGEIPWIDPATTDDEGAVFEAMKSPKIESNPSRSGQSPVAAATLAPRIKKGSTVRPIPAARRKRGSRWTPGLLLVGLLLFGLAAVTFFINPFIRVAMNSATLAQPAVASIAPLPRSGSGSWCVGGDFLNGSGQLSLTDDGNQGDLVAGDGVFSLDHIVPQPGSHTFQIVDCNNPDLAYPAAAAWLKTTQPNQQVTLLFDATGRETSLFPTAPYVVSAIDGINGFQVIGNFQYWDEGDASSHLEPLSGGLYQQVRHIAVPGAYEARFIVGDSNHSIDASGRTDDPVSLTFKTNRPGEPVVFMADTDRGRVSILYNMSPALASLAFGNGYRLLSYALAGLGAILLAIMAARLFTLNSGRLRMENGCPQCGQQELMRVSRRTSQRILSRLGVPAYRYRCRNCTWEGTRLSDVGEAFSPGSLFAGGHEG